MAAASLAGLLFPASIYPTEELRRAFVSNDVVNLFIGLPILLGAMWLARRGHLLGLLFWPGALFYATYNYIAYAVAMPLTRLFIIDVALVLVSIYTIYGLLSNMDGEAVQAQLKGRVFERLTGGVLIGFGALFFLMAAGKVLGHVAGQAALPWPQVSVQIADLLVTPAWLVGGILLWRKRALGYAGGAGLLFQASMLFVALLVFFILQPFVAGAPFPVNDFVVIAVMSLICLIPFGLFLRGAATSKG
jgi:hypothetical protein